MSEGICDFGFAICDLPGQRGEAPRRHDYRQFNAFSALAARFLPRLVIEPCSSMRGIVP